MKKKQNLDMYNLVSIVSFRYVRTYNNHIIFVSTPIGITSAITNLLCILSNGFVKIFLVVMPREN